jgi:hypothetical protein
MVVYVEYAFLENFVLDGVLLFLALKATKTPVKWRKLLLAAAFGGIFALVFPLLILPNFATLFIKTAAALLLCLIAFPSVKTRVERGKFLCAVACFFAFTFCFGGALIALNAKGAFIVLGFAVAFVFALGFIKKLYQKRAIEKFVYDCAIAYKQRSVSVLAFFDSGNFASYKGKPVHFLSPEIGFEIWEEEVWQKGEELCISTLAGEKKCKVFRGDLEVKEKESATLLKGAYFALSTNMLSRGYKLLLNSRVFEENGVKTQQRGEKQ